MEFSFADSGDVMDEQPHQFGSRFLSALSVALHGTLFLQRFPWIRAITSILPESLLEVFNPQLGNLFGLVRVGLLIPRLYGPRELIVDTMIRLSMQKLL